MTLFILVIGSLLSFILGLLTKVAYDAITRRKQKLIAAQSFISKIDLLMSSLEYFESYYFDEFIFLDKVRVTFPIEYVIDKIDLQDSFGLESPNTNELSLLYHGSQYYLISLSTALQKRNNAISEANKMIGILIKANNEQKPDIKRELRRIIFNLRAEQKSIRALAVFAKELIINIDLKKLDRYFRFSKWESIGEIYRSGHKPILRYSHFKKGPSDLIIPRSYRDLYWRQLLYRIWSPIRKLYPF